MDSLIIEKVKKLIQDNDEFYEFSTLEMALILKSLKVLKKSWACVFLQVISGGYQIMEVAALVAVNYFQFTKIM